MGNIYKHMGEKLRKYEALKRALPIALGNQAVNHFQNNFRTGGFDNEKWKEVQRRIPGTKAYKYPKTRDRGRRTRAILVKKGTLRKDIRVRQASFNNITIATSMPYARAHNRGTGRMPRRKYMGKSSLLREKQKRMIKGFLKRI